MVGGRGEFCLSFLVEPENLDKIEERFDFPAQLKNKTILNNSVIIHLAHKKRGLVHVFEHSCKYCVDMHAKVKQTMMCVNNTHAHYTNLQNYTIK